MEERNLILTFSFLGVLAIIIEIVVPMDYHPYYWWHAFIGFDFLFGAIGCFILILIAKWVLFPIIKRDQDIYERSPEE